MEQSEVRWGGLQPILQELADRITAIEQFLAASGLQVPSQPGNNFGDVFDAVPSTFTPGGSGLGQVVAEAHGINTGSTAPAQSGIPEYIIVLAKTGRKIEAIKEYRTLTGVDLKEAKTVVDRLAILGY
jgi:ribosomal L7/L12-like protein